MDITLTDIENLQNESTAVGALNANFDAIETAFETVLSAEGPNVLSSNLDLNSNRITNLPAAVSSTEPVRKAEFDAADLGAYGAALIEVDAAIAAAETATTAALAAAAGTLGDGTVTAAKLAPDAVTTVKILDANVTAAKLASDSVTTAKILDANVTTAKIAADSVTNAKLADMVTSTVKGNLSGSTDNPTDVTLADLATALLATGSFGGVPSGSVSAYAGSTAPTGWLECDGTAISRTTYADLFTTLSTTYGVGDGSTTFNVPDLRGEFIRGWDHSRGIDSGRAIGSTQTDLFKAHTHVAVGSGFAQGNWAFGANGYYAGQTQVSGSTGGTETRPRNVALMYVIKT